MFKYYSNDTLKQVKKINQNFIFSGNFFPENRNENLKTILGLNTKLNFNPFKASNFWKRSGRVLEIKKVLSSVQVRIPFVSLLLLGGVISTQPVLSKQLKVFNRNTILATEIQVGNKSWLQGDLPHQHSSKRSLHGRHTLSLAKISTNQSNKKPKLIALVDQPQKSVTKSQVAPISIPKQDGVYLYGQSPKPNQVGQGYIVFEQHNGKAVGALYMPNSEFSCFNGTLNPNGELAMTVKSGAGEQGNNDVAENNKLPSFNSDEPNTYAYSVTLQNYHQLTKVSSSDRQILQSCKANAQNSGATGEE